MPPTMELELTQSQGVSGFPKEKIRTKNRKPVHFQPVEDDEVWRRSAYNEHTSLEALRRSMLT